VLCKHQVVGSNPTVIHQEPKENPLGMGSR